MSGDLTGWLDQLDAARAAATPGEWSVRGTAIEPRVGGTHGSYADAALIVAAVNALPRLTAALRGALALADELALHTVDPETEADRAYIRGLDLAADRIRAAVAAAVDGAR